MKETISPVRCLRQWQFLKSKAIAIPILVIIIGFIISMANAEFIGVKYISLVAFLVYMVVVYVYRLQNPALTDIENAFLSPITGKVFSVETRDNMIRIKIRKSMLDAADVRCSLKQLPIIEEDEVVYERNQHKIVLVFETKAPHFFTGIEAVRSSLIGILTKGGLVTITFSESLLKSPLQVKPGDIVISGETMLAELLPNDMSVQDESK